MKPPRRSTIANIAKEAHFDDYATVSGYELDKRLAAMQEPNWAGIPATELRTKLSIELDGARPLY